MKVRLGCLLLFLFVVAGAADAQNARGMRQQVEASMLVTGHVDIDLQGRVSAHVIDQPDKLPPYVLGFLAEEIPALRFEPVLVDGEPALARATMSLRLVAQPVEDEVRISIRSMHFGENEVGADTDSVRAAQMQPPPYPMSVLGIGGSGTVYLLVRIGRDGSVEDVVAEQVNLTALGTKRQMDSIRAALERSALAAAREWSFIPPTTGDAVSRPYWTARIPVQFTMDGQRSAGYGEWAAYHPGPQRARPNWAASTASGFSPDALAAGGVHPEQSRFRLLTPQGG